MSSQIEVFTFEDVKVIMGMIMLSCMTWRSVTQFSRTGVRNARSQDSTQ